MVCYNYNGVTDKLYSIGSIKKILLVRKLARAKNHQEEIKLLLEFAHTQNINNNYLS